QRYRSRAVCIRIRRTDPKGRLPKRIDLSILFGEASDPLSLLGLPSDRSENAFRRFFNLVERPNPSPEARDDLARLFQAAEQMAQSVQSQQRPSRTPGLSCDS